MLGGLDIGHERLGEVGKVAPAKERKRKPAQTLGERDALTSALLIDDTILVVVLESLAHKQHDKVRGERYHPTRKGYVERIEAERTP